jgi:hypothetical protein
MSERLKPSPDDYFIEFTVKGISDGVFLAGPMTEQMAEQFLWDLPLRQVAGDKEANMIASAKKTPSELAKLIKEKP